MYSIHEIEEMNYNPRPEAENCFAEAHMARSAYEPKVHGEGDYEIYEKGLWRCKATDAVVGEYTEVIWRFATKEEAEAKLEALCAAHDDPWFDEVFFDKNWADPAPVDKTVTEWGELGDGEEIPF